MRPFPPPAQPGAALQRGSLQRGMLQRGMLQRGMLQRGMLQRGSLQRGSLQRGTVQMEMLIIILAVSLPVSFALLQVGRAAADRFGLIVTVLGLPFP